VPLGRVLDGHRVRIAGLSVADGTVWVIGGYSRTKLDRRFSRRVFQYVPVAGYLWRINAETHKIVARIRLPSTPDSVATGAGSV